MSHIPKNRRASAFLQSFLDNEEQNDKSDINLLPSILDTSLDTITETTDDYFALIIQEGDDNVQQDSITPRHDDNIADTITIPDHQPLQGVSPESTLPSLLATKLYNIDTPCKTFTSKMHMYTFDTPDGPSQPITPPSPHLTHPHSPETHHQTPIISNNSTNTLSNLGSSVIPTLSRAHGAVGGYFSHLGSFASATVRALLFETNNTDNGTYSADMECIDSDSDSDDNNNDTSPNHTPAKKRKSTTQRKPSLSNQPLPTTPIPQSLTNTTSIIDPPISLGHQSRSLEKEKSAEQHISHQISSAPPPTPLIVPISRLSRTPITLCQSTTQNSNRNSSLFSQYPQQQQQPQPSLPPQPHRLSNQQSLPLDPADERYSLESHYDTHTRRRSILDTPSPMNAPHVSNTSLLLLPPFSLAPLTLPLSATASPHLYTTTTTTATTAHDDNDTNTNQSSSSSSSSASQPLPPPSFKSSTQQQHDMTTPSLSLHHANRLRSSQIGHTSSSSSSSSLYTTTGGAISLISPISAAVTPHSHSRSLRRKRIPMTSSHTQFADIPWGTPVRSNSVTRTPHLRHTLHDNRNYPNPNKMHPIFHLHDSSSSNSGSNSTHSSQTSSTSSLLSSQDRTYPSPTSSRITSDTASHSNSLSLISSTSPTLHSSHAMQQTHRALRKSNTPRKIPISSALKTITPKKLQNIYNRHHHIHDIGDGTMTTTTTTTTSASTTPVHLQSPGLSSSSSSLHYDPALSMAPSSSSLTSSSILTSTSSSTSTSASSSSSSSHHIFSNLNISPLLQTASLAKALQIVITQSSVLFGQGKQSTMSRIQLIATILTFISASSQTVEAIQRGIELLIDNNTNDDDDDHNNNNYYSVTKHSNQHNTNSLLQTSQDGNKHDDNDDDGINNTHNDHNNDYSSRPSSPSTTLPSSSLLFESSQGGTSQSRRKQSNKTPRLVRTNTPNRHTSLSNSNHSTPIKRKQRNASNVSLTTTATTATTAATVVGGGVSPSSTQHKPVKQSKKHKSSHGSTVTSSLKTSLALVLARSNQRKELGMVANIFSHLTQTYHLRRSILHTLPHNKIRLITLYRFILKYKQTVNISRHILTTFHHDPKTIANSLLFVSKVFSSISSPASLVFKISAIVINIIFIIAKYSQYMTRNTNIQRLLSGIVMDIMKTISYIILFLDRYHLFHAIGISCFIYTSYRLLTFINNNTIIHNTMQYHIPRVSSLLYNIQLSIDNKMNIIFGGNTNTNTSLQLSPSSSSLVTQNDHEKEDDDTNYNDDTNIKNNNKKKKNNMNNPKLSIIYSCIDKIVSCIKYLIGRRTCQCKSKYHTNNNNHHDDSDSDRKKKLRLIGPYHNQSLYYIPFMCNTCIRSIITTIKIIVTSCASIYTLISFILFIKRIISSFMVSSSSSSSSLSPRGGIDKYPHNNNTTYHNNIYKYNIDNITNNHNSILVSDFKAAAPHLGRVVHDTKTHPSLQQQLRHVPHWSFGQSSSSSLSPVLSLQTSSRLSSSLPSSLSLFSHPVGPDHHHQLGWSCRCGSPMLLCRCHIQSTLGNEQIELSNDSYFNRLLVARSSFIDSSSPVSLYNNQYNNSIHTDTSPTSVLSSIMLHHCTSSSLQSTYQHPLALRSSAQYALMETSQANSPFTLAFFKGLLITPLSMVNYTLSALYKIGYFGHQWIREVLYTMLAYKGIDYITNGTISYKIQFYCTTLYKTIKHILQWTQHKIISQSIFINKIISILLYRSIVSLQTYMSYISYYINIIYKTYIPYLKSHHMYTMISQYIHNSTYYIQYISKSISLLYIKHIRPYIHRILSSKHIQPIIKQLNRYIYTIYNISKSIIYNAISLCTICTTHTYHYMQHISFSIKQHIQSYYQYITRIMISKYNKCMRYIQRIISLYSSHPSSLSQRQSSSSSLPSPSLSPHNNSQHSSSTQTSPQMINTLDTPSSIPRQHSISTISPSNAHGIISPSLADKSTVQLSNHIPLTPSMDPPSHISLPQGHISSTSTLITPHTATNIANTPQHPPPQMTPMTHLRYLENLAQSLDQSPQISHDIIIPQRLSQIRNSRYHPQQQHLPHSSTNHDISMTPTMPSFSSSFENTKPLPMPSSSSSSSVAAAVSTPSLHSPLQPSSLSNIDTTTTLGSSIIPFNPSLTTNVQNNTTTQTATQRIPLSRFTQKTQQPTKPVPHLSSRQIIDPECHTGLSGQLSSQHSLPISSVSSASRSSHTSVAQQPLSIVDTQYKTSPARRSARRLTMLWNKQRSSSNSTTPTTTNSIVNLSTAYSPAHHDNITQQNTTRKRNDTLMPLTSSYHNNNNNNHYNIDVYDQ